MLVCGQWRKLPGCVVTRWSGCDHCTLPSSRDYSMCLRREEENTAKQFKLRKWRRQVSKCKMLLIYHTNHNLSWPQKHKCLLEICDPVSAMFTSPLIIDKAAIAVVSKQAGDGRSSAGYLIICCRLLWSYTKSGRLIPMAKRGKENKAVNLKQVQHNCPVFRFDHNGLLVTNNLGVASYL